MRLLDLDAFARASEPYPGSYHPVFVKLARDEMKSFRELSASRGILVYDTVDRQLAELAAVRVPGGDPERLRQWVEERLPTYGGFWAYLPWERKVARLLEPDDYVEVVTNRNRNKITREEQRLLRTKRVGIMGLSVGGEAAVTIAQEHLCGHLHLADFDPLDLSNLNRLHAGFDELGQNKAVLVARRIARIDPYLEVTVFEDGVTGDNVDRFLDGLDLLVEECDHLPMKLAVREKARARRLNVVFAGDERGFLSVEPYQKFPELPPFHGRVASPPPPSGFRGGREFFRALTEWLGGWNAISERSRKSLELIGESLVGYPQLASEARYAAGQIGHVSRRLLLGESLAPFLGHIDLEVLLPRSPFDRSSAPLRNPGGDPQPI